MIMGNVSFEVSCGLTFVALIRFILSHILFSSFGAQMCSRGLISCVSFASYLFEFREGLTLGRPYVLGLDLVPYLRHTFPLVCDVSLNVITLCSCPRTSALFRLCIVHTVTTLS